MCSWFYLPMASKLPYIFYLRPMYLYNISIIVEDSESQTVKSLLISQLALARKEGLSIKLLELLDSPHEGVTYSLQLDAVDSGVVADFQTDHLAVLQTQTNRLGEGKVFYFESLMQHIG